MVGACIFFIIGGLGLCAVLADAYNTDNCYSEMSKIGFAKDGKCHGLYGGDQLSEHLDYRCIDCPYLAEEDNKNEK